MPISKNDPLLDYDGSWGDASKGWPEIQFSTLEEAQAAHHFAWKHCKVPYGSYVLAGKSLRLETEAYKSLVLTELQKERKA